MPLFFSLFSFASFGSHIVGGEIQFYVTNSSTNRYFVGLNLYFDAANGRPAAETQTVTLYFFRKSDNFAVGNINVPQTVRKNVSYTNPNCTVNNDLSTYFISYGQEVVLNPNSFSDPQGYYIVWERCCRNVIVSNIQNPTSTGATFYLAFPPLIKNGQPFVNSSPRTSELAGDYVCINRPFTFDFSAKDPDGDSLVYSLTVPFRGYSGTGNAEPIATGSSSYPEVIWASGISVDNMIPGPKPLTVNRQTGKISVTAGQLGLFVFAISIEEYRKGVKIGLVRREFQLKVVDCPKNDAPVALFRQIDRKEFYNEGQVITIKANESKCMDILITDPEANQRLSITTKALNFGDKNLTINPSVFTTRSTKDTLKAQLCISDCVESRNNQPLVLEVIVQDYGCPQPLYDTLTIRVIVEPAAINKPTIYTDLLVNDVSVQYGNTLKFNVIGGAANGSDFILEAKGRGFDMASVGMTFMNTMAKGTIKQPFSWTPTCTASNRDYVVDFIITTTACSVQLKDTVSVKMRASTRPNQKPKVSTSLPNQKIEIASGQSIVFDVYGDDFDKDNLTLSGVGKGFDLKQYGIKFDTKQGMPRLTSRFEWQPDCAFIEKNAGRLTTVQFVVEDNSCATNRYDTTAVQLTVLPIAPSLVDSVLTNVITPNNDGKNDCFSINYKFENLCGPQFEYVEIVNRWGRIVFMSKEPTFKWCAENLTAGTYFYGMKFTNKFLKGAITLIK